MKSGFRIAAIGELLWDLLPAGPRLGGAPANFAAIAANLAGGPDTGAADEVFLVSRVGDDRMGSDALREMSAHGVRLDHVSVDSAHATGRVQVALQTDRSPVYTIEHPAAWDFIPKAPELIALAPALDAVCFGTLAQRSPETRQTLRRLVEATQPGCVRVFDVNLRDPWWTPEILAWGLDHATILKMSAEEVFRVAESVGLLPSANNSPLRAARALLQQFPIQMIAITRGAEGSLLVTAKQVDTHPGVATDVEDPVGAGDAFTAAMTRAWLQGDPPSRISGSANQWGAWVASQAGGMPLPDEAVRRRIAAATSASSSERRFSVL